MHDLIITQTNLLLSTLDATMRAEFGERISGLSYNGTNLRVHFFDPYTGADETAAQAIVDVHDPVFITAERAGENITVTLNKPRNIDSATELTLLIDDEAAATATTLTDNVGVQPITCADELTFGIVEDYPHEEATI